MRNRKLRGRASVVALAALLVAATAAAQAAPAATDAKALTDLLRAFLDGAGRNDAAMHNRFWADDLVYTSATGVRRGKAEIMNGLRTPPRDAGNTPPQTGPGTTYSAEDIRIQQYGDTAIVAFRLVATPHAPAAASSSAKDDAAAKAAPPAKAGSRAAGDAAAAVQNFLNTGTFLRRNGEWRVVAWQATRIPAPDAQPK